MIDFRSFKSGSEGNLYTVHDGKSALMIECGRPWREIQRRLGFRTSAVSGVLISHHHDDHSHSVRDALKWGRDCYMSDGCASTLGVKGMPGVHIVQAKVPFSVGSWEVLPLDVEHDAPDPLAFVLTSGRSKMLYVTDTAYLRYRVPGLEVIAVEANYSGELVAANIEAGAVHPAMKPRLLQTHMSIDTCRQLLLANDLSRVVGIWLLHLSDRNADAESFRRTIQEATGKPVYIA